MNAKPLIYVAGPYTNPDPVLNTHNAVKTGLWLRDTFDVGVIIPHVTLLAHAIEPRDVDYWYEYDLDQVRWCHGLWRMPGASSGADKEVQFARDLRIPIWWDGYGRENTRRRDLAAWLENVCHKTRFG